MAAPGAPNAYVTGSNGFVGINLCAELARLGWRVLALHRRTSDLRYLEPIAVENVVGDINDRESLARTLPREVDAVFHVAGSTSLWSRNDALQDRINIEGTRNVVAAALAAGARRFVHTSSISAWGMCNGRIDETTPQIGDRSPVNYQRSKFAAEREVERGIAQGLDAVILNPAGILGPYDTGGYVRLFRMVNAGTLPGVPPGAGSFCDVREVAKAHVAAAERGRRGERYLLGGADASYLELVQVIGELAGRPVPARTTPAWLMKAVGAAGEFGSRFSGREPGLTRAAATMATRRLSCDCTKAERELGFMPVALRSMAADCFRWMKQAGRLEG